SCLRATVPARAVIHGMGVVVRQAFTVLTNPLGHFLKLAVAIFTAAAIVATAAPASANPKYAGIVMDAKTGKVLYEENADAKRYPASLTKMMTLYLIFEALES